MTWREMFNAIPEDWKDSDVSIRTEDDEYLSLAGIETKAVLNFSNEENEAPLDDEHPFIDLGVLGNIY